MITATKPVRREVESDRGPLIVTIGMHGVTLREKGRRVEYGPVTWSAIYSLGARIEAATISTRTKRGGRS